MIDFTCVVLGFMFFAFGIAFALGKVHTHLSVWKTMQQEEKDKIKIIPLCRNIGEVIMLNGLIFLLKGLWKDYDNYWFTLTMVAWLVVAGFDVWNISKSKRYQKK